MISERGAQIDTWSGTVGVANDCGSSGEHGLHLIPLWHWAFPFGKKLDDMVERFRSEFEGSIESLRDGFARQIVGCGPQSPRRDDNVGSHRCILKNLDIVSQMVTNSCMKCGANAEITQSLAQPLAVRIQAIPTG
jgi:hypothetical protein